MVLPHEIFGILRGLQAVVNAGVKLQESSVKTIWQNSDVKQLAENTLSTKSRPLSSKSNPNLAEIFQESGERLNIVIDGMKQYVLLADNRLTPPTSTQLTPKETLIQPRLAVPKKEDPIETSIQPLLALAKKVDPKKKFDLEIKLTPSDRELLQKLDVEHREKLNAQTKMNQLKISDEKKTKAAAELKSKEKEGPKSAIRNMIKAIPNPKSRPKLSDTAKERPVPASRIARIASFGSLAAGLGVGTLAEYVRRSVGFGDKRSSDSTLFMSQANLDRIVDTLCKVRGAALKMGQMLSIQDESLVSPVLSKALERVRKSADFMPSWQLKEVLGKEIGQKWCEQLVEFDEKPFAAASIGQVHWGRTVNDEEVAIKVQYPGVAQGIESDIDNLVGIMKVWDVFPKGMFIDNVVAVAKRELAWEVDYVREKECTKKFRELLKPYPEFYVPKTIDSLCSGQVLTTEYIEGIPVDQCVDLDLEDRKFIANKILELVLLELMEFRYMQTDPNWANFFYDPKTKRLLLLDFGASREYPKEFVTNYAGILKAAADNDREAILEGSRRIGMLTGYETKVMEDAHTDAVIILGEVFQTPTEYNFRGKDTIARVQNLVPTMVGHRLRPPPEEIYSLHRKLSGVFLLCAKLNAPLSARSIFLSIYDKYQATIR